MIICNSASRYFNDGAGSQIDDELQCSEEASQKSSGRYLGLAILSNGGGMTWTIQRLWLKGTDGIWSATDLASVSDESDWWKVYEIAFKLMEDEKIELISDKDAWREIDLQSKERQKKLTL